MSAPHDSTTGTGKGLWALTMLTVLALVLAAGTWWIMSPLGGKRITAYFSSAVGLYVGSTVRVLGIPIGTVDEVTPQGQLVRVTMTVDASRPIPANANAVVVAPSLVSDRFVQLSPVYVGGAQLDDGSVIPVERTITPVELDELYKSLDRLSVALGPDGANADGAVSRMLDVLAANIKGNGATVNETIKQFAESSRTLAGSADQLFGTVDGIQRFTTMLARNDAHVVEFTKQLRDVSANLAAERTELAGALAELASALEQVRGFINDNREKIKSNVDKLIGITEILVDQRASLAEALDVAPNAVTNLMNAINPATGALESRANLLEWFPGSMVACNLPTSGTAVTSLTQGCRELRPAAGAAEGGPSLPLPAVGTTYSSAEGR
ncbi:ABC transporter substrate-binding protein [Longimycelium tulufanense]|uniref:ABC transporter substrate-binding protein n=1 Tax=Longimycelium tulufanense TaxID=907463 RepID=A0A8J3CG59_9PSEU|nr:MCE family protein [Longimycelium tulufanense]GGM60823.1 ABC transporter substrate-binding protein [Longimycelium tulufanense]